MHFKYCPECGALLTDRDAGDDGKVPFCEECGKYWFDQFASCVIVLIYNEYDEIVLSWQDYLSEKYAVFTSGFMTPGENAEEAARREVKEELGLDIEELDALVLVSMELGNDPDAMEPDIGSEVLCHN